MTRDVEAEVRDRLGAAQIPGAPPDLRAFVSQLGAQPVPVPRRFEPRRAAMLAATMLLVGIAGGTALSGALPKPSAEPTSTPGPNGMAVHEEAGISFSYPATWRIGTIPEPWTSTWSHEYLVYLHPGPCDPDTPTPSIPLCDMEMPFPGTVSLIVSRYPHPVPGEVLFGRPPSFGPDPSFELRPLDWFVVAPDESLYQFQFRAPDRDQAPYRPTFEAIVRSVVVSSRPDPSPPPAGSWTLESADVSITVPRSWSAYRFMPWYVGMAGSGQPTFVLASAPLEPCAAVESCHLTNPPVGGATIQFRISLSAFSTPDWSAATDSVGGHPAFRTEAEVASGIEHSSWRIQLYREGNTEVDIDVAVRWMASDALRAQVEALIESIQLQDEPTLEIPREQPG